jgi:hypothetical protein
MPTLPAYRFALLALVMLAFGCDRSTPGSVPQPADHAARAEWWRADLRYFARELTRRHVDPFKYVTRAVFDSAVAEVDSAITGLSDRQIRWRFMRLTALLRDGHTNGQMPVYPVRLPITTLWTDDGPYITGATAEYRSLVGSRIARLNGRSITAVADTIRAYLAHENEMGFRQRSGWILLYPGAQWDLGLGADSLGATLDLVAPSGRPLSVTLPVVPREGFTASPPPGGEPLYRQRLNEKYWLAYLPESRTVFLKYNQCRDTDDFRALSDSAGKLVDAGASRLVVDLRHNSGGNSAVIRPLIQMIRERPALNRKTALFVVIGRGTFSSGMAAAHDLRTQTEATIVGEPIGERPNTFGEMRQLTLPNSGLVVTYSTKFFRLVGGEPEAFFPDSTIPPTPQSIVEGVDPVLEWIARRPE